ncbi:MAG: carbohydrate ABC transporter permease [Polyangiaceae bacterium]|nr:carbohydrate ABC transporter permease [Polyangiaceae bacterium]
MKFLRVLVLVPYFLLASFPLFWLGLTSLKSYEDSISNTVKFVPSAEAAAPNSVRFQASFEAYRSLAQPVAGTPNNFYQYLGNSVIVGVVSTLLAVVLGTLCAYGFSRFRIPGSKDWLFFILSTRFLPPLGVVVPVLMMYRSMRLENTHLGLVVLYTGFNLSLAVWLMKGFIDDIPRAFEEAAWMDGYSRLQTFWRVVLPEAATGMAVTAVFCLIAAWNEYGFAMTLNNYEATTVPVYFAGLQGNIKGVPWPQIGAGMVVFVAPIVLFTVLVRRHLLRGVTFGTVKG